MAEPGVHRVACGALVRSGRVLLAHRSSSKTWYPDVWDFPGGHLEGGETGPEALVRELREELGVDVSPPAHEPVLRIETGDLVLSVSRVDRWRGEPVNAAPDEHDAIGWFTPAEAERLDLADAEYPRLLRRLVH